MDDLIKYQIHLRSHPMTTIDYARKSPGKERFEARRVLLQKMVSWLQDRCLCTKVYLSLCSKSDEPLMTRDQCKDNAEYVDSITGCIGDMKGMIWCFSVYLFIQLVLFYSFPNDTEQEIQSNQTSCNWLRVPQHWTQRHPKLALGTVAARFTGRCYNGSLHKTDGFCAHRRVRYIERALYVRKKNRETHKD